MNNSIQSVELPEGKAWYSLFSTWEELEVVIIACICLESFTSGSFSCLLSFLDAFPVAVQSAGEAATAEMVHATGRPGEEEGDPGHDAVSAGSPTAFLQLPPVEGPQDCLQEVVLFSKYTIDDSLYV